MTIRTFIQQGRGYGEDPVNITAKINGVVVYQGAVDTIDQPLPPLPTPFEGAEVTLFSWEEDIEFEGTVSLEITVDSGSLLLTDSLANYSMIAVTIPYVEVRSSGPDEYELFYYETIDGVVYSDPFSDPKIDGDEVVRIRDQDPENLLTGQWYYVLPGDSVFTATVNIQKGVYPTE